MSGGGNNRAADQARADEQARMAAIRRTQGAVNNVFNDPQRQADIADYVAATRQFYTQDLDKQKATADRELRFALARGGLTGGSTQVDQQRNLGEGYAKGLLEVDRKARGAGAEIEAADQDARGRLIALATSGLDVTTAAQQAAASMRTSLEAGKSARQAQGIGNAFESLGNFFKDTKEASARRRADSAFASMYGPSVVTGGFQYGGSR